MACVRSFGRGDTIYDPWHYVPVLARKPGALRNGAPFKDWVLPAAMERVRRKLPAPMTATGRWSTSSQRCLPTGCQRSKQQNDDPSIKSLQEHPSLLEFGLTR